MKIGVLTEGTGTYSSSRIISEVKRAGHEAVVIQTSRTTPVMAKDGLHVYQGSHKLPKLDVVITRVGASLTDHGVAIVRQFESMGTRVVNGSEGILNSRNKFQAQQLLRGAKLPVPNSVLQTAHESVAVAEKVFGPKKPVIIKYDRGTQGSGVHKVLNMRAASAILALPSMKGEILQMQEFMKHAAGRDIRVFIVGKRVIGVMQRVGKKGSYKANLHQGGRAVKVKLTRFQTKMALKAARVLGLEITGLDFITDRRNLRTQIIEANSSPGLKGIETSSRVNIAKEIVRYVTRR